MLKLASLIVNFYEVEMPSRTEKKSDLEATVVVLLDASGYMARRLRAESNPTGLSWSETITLARIERAGAITIAALARADGVTPQSMRMTVQRLERAGLLVREAHPHDRRQVLFRLSQLARDTRADTIERRLHWLTMSLAALDPEEIATLRTAATLMKRIAES